MACAVPLTGSAHLPTSTEGTLRGPHSTGCEVRCRPRQPTICMRALMQQPISSGTMPSLQLHVSAQGVHSTDSTLNPLFKSVAPQTQNDESLVQLAPAQSCMGSPPCTAPARMAGCCTCLSAGKCFSRPMLLSRPLGAASGNDQHISLLNLLTETAARAQAQATINPVHHQTGRQHRDKPVRVKAILGSTKAIIPAARSRYDTARSSDATGWTVLELMMPGAGAHMCFEWRLKATPPGCEPRLLQQWL